MVAIVTDSSVGYSTAEITSRGILSVVPLNYQLGGYFYEENASGKNGDFLPLMARLSPCKTAQPALNNFIRTFQSLTDKGCDVICIVLSSALSGTYSSACFAADQVGGNIRVIDSATIGPGLHLLADEAVNMVKCGLSFEEIAAHLEELKKKIGIVFTVESLDRLLYGGRLNNAKAKATLNLRPVFELKGKILFKANARGSREKLEMLCSLVPDNVRRLIVGRCGAETDVNDFTAMLKSRFPQVYIHQRVLGPVLSIHTGVGAFGAAYVTNN